MQSTLVVKPRYPEHDLSLWLSDALQNGRILWVLLDDRSQGCEDLLNSLKELLLVGVASYDTVIGLLQTRSRKTAAFDATCSLRSTRRQQACQLIKAGAGVLGGFVWIDQCQCFRYITKRNKA